jgi:hypothetical protein
MMLAMRVLLGLVALTSCAVPADEPIVDSVEQHGVNMQGVNMQGVNMQGVNMQGVNMQGFSLDNLTLNGDLHDARIERGELVAERGATTLRGAALAGARLVAQAIDAGGTTQSLEYRIASVAPESATYDPTRTGGTFLYTLEQHVGDSWQPACEPDQDGRRVALPVAATFDVTGARVEVPGMFTFACTTGVIAKCYRWGYKPWLGGYGGANFSDLHWACTRMARADYCGDGTPHTRNGTAINTWDRLPAPGPIQRHGLWSPLGMLFEAGWNTGGAACVSRARWLLDDGLQLANLCPDRLVPPGLVGATVCDTVVEVLFQDPNALLFNESYLNLDLGLVNL